MDVGRRIEVELTSTRDDGSWTWRAAGARQPKGDLPESLLYDGAQVGDVVKAEAEFHVDGIEIVEVFAPKKKKERTDLLELKSRPLREDELVTTQRASRDDRRGGGGRRRGGRDGQRGRGGPGRDRDRTPPPDNAKDRPKPKRLRPKRVHRDALLAEVAEEHRPIVEQLVREGMPGVRAAIDAQNAEAKEAGKPKIDAAPILAIAERNLTKSRLAEWRDKADAALETVEVLDLRDLRSVVVAGSDLARDEESRELADKLKDAYDGRVESDHANWLEDLETAISDGRTVRALRLSSRPVKAGAPLPPELATQLAGQASEALAPDVGPDRWATVLDALAFSPIRGAVTPAGVPESPKQDLLDAVQRLADRIPTIAALFGIDPAKTPRSAKRRRGGRRDGGTRSKGESRPRGAGERRSGKADGGDAASTPAADSPPNGQAPTPETSASAASTPAPATADATAPGSPASDTPDAEASDAAPAQPAEATTTADACAPATEAPAPEAPAADSAASENTPADAPATESPAAKANADSPASEGTTADAPATEPAHEGTPDAPATESTSGEAPATETALDAPASVGTTAEASDATAPDTPADAGEQSGETTEPTADAGQQSGETAEPTAAEAGDGPGDEAGIGSTESETAPTEEPVA